MQSVAILLLLASLAEASVLEHYYGSVASLFRRASSTTIRSAMPTPNEPTMTGTTSLCDKWYDVVAGDTCDAVCQSFGITLSQFLAWNPAVSSDCTQNFYAGEAYCVGVGASSTSSVAASTKPPSTTTGPSMSSTGKPSSSLRVSNSTTTTSPTLNQTYSILPINTTSVSVTITNSVWPPTQTQAGQPSYCTIPIKICACRSFTRT